jgi:hypothetical protein
MKITKTQDKVNQVYLYLKQNFYNKTFNFKEVERYLMDRDIHGITFYYFVYAGVVNKISRGCYKINDSFLKTDTVTIYKKAKEQIEELRKKRNKPAGITRIPIEICTPKFLLNEFDCIAHLKSLGYKIMKPIQQFEEI